MSGKLYSPLAGCYHASKHALEAWSDCLRLELHPFGIQVVLIEPGAVATEFSHKCLNALRRIQRVHRTPL
ncbi:MAG: SDR family NAD(P)-dependent oxidoreductase [Alphaproteobacteria bacterium]|nr:SDR family NAD(P)-dependent oxidoreductase [Alphaproteobacteria bacterium]